MDRRRKVATIFQTFTKKKTPQVKNLVRSPAKTRLQHPHPHSYNHRPWDLPSARRTQTLRQRSRSHYHGADTRKLERAIDYFKKKYDGKNFILAGGVASNNFIRKKLKKLCEKKYMTFYVPEQKLCIDNATMIAWTGIEKLQNGEKGDSILLKPKPKWSLESL